MHILNATMALAYIFGGIALFIYLFCRFLRRGIADTGAERAKFDFFLNQDNIHLLNELKHAKGKEDLVREQFRVGILLLGMSVIHGLGKNADGDVVRERADQVTTAAALCPDQSGHDAASSSRAKSAWADCVLTAERSTV